LTLLYEAENLPSLIDEQSALPAIVSTTDMARDWGADRECRLEPVRLTELFQTAIPVLRHLDWRVTDTDRGFCESILPLNVESSNQHIAHQAALILLAADYTGGVALGSLLYEIPVVGIHPQKSDYGAYLWGAKADIKWIRPSSGDLICSARIQLDRREIILRRFLQGKRVLETVHVEMRNEDELVAEANVTYWVQDTQALRRNSLDENKIHVLYDYRHKTSAKLIAGLRALEQERPLNERLFEDSHSASFAGKHGLILARRFGQVAPQLQPMIAARTKHLDFLLEKFSRSGPCQVVNIGVGLDTRTFRVPLPAASTVFDLDLPSMLRRRREVLNEVQGDNAPARIELPIDLREDDLSDVVLRTGLFDSSIPALVIWEGGSMYFERANVEKILAAVGKLLSCSTSRLWMDYVNPLVFDGTSGLLVVDRFTEAMQCLGEPFINGFNDVGANLASCSLMLESDVASDIFVPDNDPVFNLYRFCTAGAKQQT
jgi:methyltransferase (TIGR00027 family)